MTAENNENWGECPKCGTPVLIDPKTNKPEPCASCASMESRTGFYLGSYILIAAAVVVALLVYFCIRLLT